MIQIEENAYQADEGKVFKNINSGLVLGNAIWLPASDSIDNYIEVDISEETIPETVLTVEELNTELNRVDSALDDLMTEILPSLMI